MKVIDGIKMYDSAEMRSLLGVTNCTLIQYRKKGMLNAVRIGRGLYTSENSLRDFLDGKTQAKEGE